MSEFLGLAFMGWVAISWITHVITCIKTASWVFLLAGAVFFPIGCVHGTGVIFGAF